MSPKGNTRKDSSLLIELKNITRSFGYGEAESFALNDFNLEVKPGEFIMIMGPSGCGKTTLLNILGLLDFPTSGSYYLDGERTTHFSKSRQAHIRAQKIGFIFQDFNLIPKMTILENVSLPLVYAGVPKTKRLVRSSKMLSYLNMQEREYYYPYQLSGGQKQRVAIARALVSSPEIILADEPTGNLDSRNAYLVMEELRRIHSEGNTIIMVTHNPNLTTYATRVIHMLDGRIATDIKTVADEDLPERIKVNFHSKKSSGKDNQPIEKENPEAIQNIDKNDVMSQTESGIDSKAETIPVIRPIKPVGSKYTSEAPMAPKNPVEKIDEPEEDYVEYRNLIDLKPIFVDTEKKYKENLQSKDLLTQTKDLAKNADSKQKSSAEISSKSTSYSSYDSKSISYKFPETTAISVEKSDDKDFKDKKSTFPIVSSSSTDNSVRIVKKPTSLLELENSSVVKKKSKTKTKLNKSNKKQAKGRRK